jgi:hypothetical protein
MNATKWLIEASSGRCLQKRTQGCVPAQGSLEEKPAKQVAESPVLWNLINATSVKPQSLKHF